MTEQMVRPVRGAPALQAAQTARSASRRTSDLGTYDLFLRACALHSTHHMQHTLALPEEANARDPRPRSGLCRALLPSCLRCLCPGSRGDPAEGNRVWTPGRRTRGRRSGILADAADDARRFRRRHRRDDAYGRSRARLEPKLRSAGSSAASSGFRPGRRIWQ